MENQPPILDKSLELARALCPQPEEFDLRTWHFTAIWLKNRLLSVGINKKRTHPRNLLNKKFNREGLDISGEKYSCSEIIAWLKLGKRRNTIDLNKCIMVNIRVDRNGNIGLSRPCKSCESLLQYIQPKKVYFTNEKSTFELYSI